MKIETKLKMFDKKIVLVIVLGMLLSMVFIPSLVSGRDEPKRAKTHLYASGKGMIIYGYNWYPPYPGEPFFIGSDDAMPPFLGMLGEPEWSAKFTESELDFTGESWSLVEAPVRPDPPYALPLDLTKYWLMEMTGTGSIEASWVKDEEENTLEIELWDEGESILGVWTGPPGTSEWGFYAAGGPHPQILPFMSYTFSGTLNDESINGYICKHDVGQP